jgi:hypothetical protein
MAKMTKKQEVNMIPDDKVPTVCCGCKEILTYPRAKAGNWKINALGFKCPQCSCVNSITNWIKKPVRLNKDTVAKDYLECIAYTGNLSDDAVGLINDGRRPLYVDINGHQWSRDEFIKEFGNDPAAHILKRIRYHQMYDEIDADIRGY